MGDSMQPAVLESPSSLTAVNQLSFEVIAGNYELPSNRPGNYTLVKGTA